ncbi:MULTISPECIES: DegT/DnrJ/EryC1/StrS family aminotransferase [unclassified Pseudomonas]|uniref:DegT/DnrJ/EryC1/StrS aminotransferase family protein n=1 Tax=unclassified Pseudomonas TaxID=196821 RepID=UPI0021C77C58|nr:MULTISPECIES: DegT/DnrJ/EryC1/StrS family aminotransferase [unclassified Pseudomonas]MCU1730129.1 DegT/DnrJ/EryC1/StrS family aminotransferase [Pseudomonas sp. 20P_3.2_Bac4]MCU1747564.1 DegT/DnrJ/EryC1/StrS family aminotransferase [Pseudomonas sp. 20P_3.2_Bac5]
MLEKLAVYGGATVHDGNWPNWPQSNENTRRNVNAVLDSHRWSISGQYRGQPSWEERFGQAFAIYTGAGYCVPSSTGTASLSMALEACEVGAYDEVIVPGVSWVASASAVLGINAIPVLTDVEPETGCLDPVALESAITSRTRAITVVHLGSAVANLDRLVAIAQAHSIPLIEDCAQAHGARYAGRHVGCFGAAGTFSMQHSKLLTSGEGGAVITNNEDLARRLAHLRADGRTLSEQPLGIDEMALVETAEIMGNNHCLSEFHAAILMAQLEVLDEQLAHRRRNAAVLDSFLLSLGFLPQATASRTTERAHYTYVVRLPESIVETQGAERFAVALSAEIRLPCKTMYRALNQNRLYNPSSRNRFELGQTFTDAVDPSRYQLPIAQNFSRSCIALPHRMLLADMSAIEHVAAAFEKVARLINNRRV